MLIAMLCSALYAQELRLGGYFNSGLGIVANDVENEDPVIRAFGVDSEQPGYRLRLNGTYTNEANNAGVRFRLQSQANLGSNTTINVGGENVTVPNLLGYFSMPFAFGWVGFMENRITLSGGIIEDNTWVTGDWWLGSESLNPFSGLGALLKVTPVDGLILGAGTHVIGRAGGSENNRLQKVNFGQAVDLGDARYVAHAVYTMPDLFRIDLSYRTEADVGGDNSSRLFGDIRLLAVDNLTAVVAAGFNNLGEDYDTSGEMLLSQTLAYRIDAIRLGLNAAQWLSNVENRDPGLLFNLWGSYTINNLIPRLDLAYFMGGSSTANWHRRAFAPAWDSDVSLFSARPSLRINLDNRTHLEIGDMVNVDFKGDDRNLTNVFYIDFTLSF
jgi:hypothetical protein